MSAVTAAGKLTATVTAVPGVYDSGLITVFDDELGKKVLSDWQWFLSDAIGLASTWQGNIFFWSPKHSACFYLDTQRGKTTFVDKSVDALFNTFLVKEGVKKDVLFDGLFKEVYARVGGLGYCESYIANPWPMLGGSGGVETFDKGDTEVYVSLTGQTIRKFMSKD